ncbi:MAG: hypothetical protein ABSD38_10645 [Syntrophorhabdales bacterium]|jgi:tetratricopeptide (TPR) repeat protein
MREVSVRDCYRMLKDCPDTKGISWLSRVPMVLLAGASRAYLYAVYLFQQGKPDRARSFLALAEGLADDRDRPYVLLLKSVVEYLTGDAERAAEIGREAEGGAEHVGDKELLADVWLHLAETYRATGNTTAAEECERNADRARRRREGKA